MHAAPRGLLPVICSAILLLATAAVAETLSFKERVLAQEAIDRVYYSHQVGATRPFEEAMPREARERKVRAYLQTPVTEAALDRELLRIEHSTQLPGRLQEIRKALNYDPQLLRECLARPALVERLTNSSSATRDSDCLDDIWMNGALGQALAARRAARAVWTGIEMIIWGGWGVDALSLDGSRYDPLTDTWTPIPTSGAPPASISQTVVWTGSEMIVWGGSHPGGRFDPSTASWSPVSSVGAPAPRGAHTAIWTGSEMIVWGGSNLDTGGRYDPATDSWSDTATEGAPGSRSWHTAVWTGSEMIVWGGLDTGGALDTGGRYDPVTDSWTETTLVGAPDPNALHSAIWTGSEMIVWGGGGCCSPVPPGPGWRYDPSTDSWSPTSTVDAPADRTDFTMIWTGSEMIVWGGEESNFSYRGGRYDPATDSWAPIAHEDEPGWRFDHVAVWTGSEMIVWGGEGPMSYQNLYNDGARYDPATDSWTATAPPFAPQGGIRPAIWTGNLFIVWGGDGLGYGADRQEMDSGGRYDPLLDQWSPTSMTGAPEARGGHSMVWSGEEVLVWGGMHDNVRLASGGRYDPLFDRWAPISEIAAPQARNLHSAVWTGAEMVVWGGADSYPTVLDTGGRYDPFTDSWLATSTATAPPARYEHTAVWTGSEMVVWGGRDYSVHGMSTGGRYDPVADSWAPTSLDGAPDPRYLHTSIWSGSEMIVWGGNILSAWEVQTGGRYDPFTDSWLATSTATAPPARYEHTAVWTGDRMLVWGGDGSGVYTLKDGGLYDPLTDSWEPTVVDGAPSARRRHAAVWAGDRMLVWGGFGEGGVSYEFLNTGGAYLLGGRDSDSDGEGDACDNCPSLPNSGQEDGDSDGWGDLCDNCPDHANYEQSNDDGDPAGNACDCALADDTIYPDAPEVNNGLDNQCPGDRGYAVIDEISGLCGFLNPADKQRFSWPEQGGATSYQIARSNSRDFSTGCLMPLRTTTSTFWIDSAPVAAGVCHYYLVRALTPNEGSWGQDSDLIERTSVCP